MGRKTASKELLYMLDNSDSSLENRPEVWVEGKVDGLIGTAGATLGELMAGTRKVYMFGGNPTEVVEGMETTMRVLDKTRAINLFVRAARTVAPMFNDKGGLIKTTPTIPSDRFVRQVLDSEEFTSRLTQIDVMSPCPLLVEQGGELVVVHGGNVIKGVYAEGEAPAIPGTIEEAKAALEEIVEEFDFVSKGDKSRALSAIVSPLLAMGNLFGGRVPIYVCEADCSQAGKGFFHKLVRAVYAHQAGMVNFGNGGVGSAGEAFDTALVSGKVFIQLDNVRGKISSQKIESFMTEDKYSARPAYSKNIEIDPKRTIISMTTNCAEMTEDLTNRCLTIRIRKRKGYEYKKFDEGNLLDHVKANQPKYLGAAMKIVQEWHSRRCPQDMDARLKHDFRDHAGITEFIAREILGQPSMFDGYEAVRERMFNPDLSWLREIGLVMVKSAKARKAMTAKAILEILEDEGRYDLQPGVKPHESIESGGCLQKAQRMFGRKMSGMFNELSEILIEDVLIRRTAKRIKRDDGKGHRNQLVYSFEALNA